MPLAFDGINHLTPVSPNPVIKSRCIPKRGLSKPCLKMNWSLKKGAFGSGLNPASAPGDEGEYLHDVVVF